MKFHEIPLYMTIFVTVIANPSIVKDIKTGGPTDGGSPVSMAARRCTHQPAPALSSRGALDCCVSSL